MAMDAEDYGAVAYNAYRATTGGRSAISGDELPEWGDQDDKIQLAWTRAAGAVRSVVGREVHDRAEKELTLLGIPEWKPLYEAGNEG